MMEQASKNIAICLVGATGKMGREVLKSLPNWTGIELVSVLGVKAAGKNLREVVGNDAPDLLIGQDLNATLKSKKADVLVDLTQPDVALSHALCAIENGVSPVIGTSGLSSADMQKIEAASKSTHIPSIIVPNFSIGAVLGMKFAQLAARWMTNVEIIELHHDKKLDAPSGTAIETARLIHQTRTHASTVPETKYIKVPGVRGGKHCEVPIHSIRLGGVLAQQSVIFGGPGETLEIKHSVIDRSTYMSGLELAIRKIRNLSGLTLGLETLLFD